MTCAAECKQTADHSAGTPNRDRNVRMCPVRRKWEQSANELATNTALSWHTFLTARIETIQLATNCANVPWLIHLARSFAAPFVIIKAYSQKCVTFALNWGGLAAKLNNTICTVQMNQSDNKKYKCTIGLIETICETPHDRSFVCRGTCHLQFAVTACTNRTKQILS